MRVSKVIALLVMGICIGGSPAHAGSLTDLQAAVDGFAASGKISDPDVRAMLLDLIAKARTAADTVAEASFRGSMIDIVDSFEGTGVTEDAASSLRSLARYE